ncbi:hypothetical protein BDV95DRAFT_626826 [Massariosphaeria phaeospora]|uniref:Ubiquitin-like domain-containing protein n=1 Tax=Massariosphaeria phaeospora TaxID=100035 RepID=A0A7C8I9J0_9PLEO|nr:hypothetical protein BDV95DRAFT_626826 [Massariosphaeria phaeospora]
MADDQLTINLKVLSPSTEVDDNLNFHKLPASTTIKELRLKIQDAVASRPAAERMRLIYRGKVLPTESETLANVFGLDNIRNSPDWSLHLVLRELNVNQSSAPSPAPRSATAPPPPNPFRPAQFPPQTTPPPTNPFRAAPQPRPNSQPQVPHPHHHHHHHHHPQQPQNPFGRLAIPPELQQHLAQAMPPNWPPNNAQNPVPNQQPRNDSTASSESAQAQAAPGRTGVTPEQPNIAPNSSRTIRHEAIGPNGERWTMTFNNTNITIPANAHQHPILPRAFPHPPGFPIPARPVGSPAPGETVERAVSRVRESLQAASQERENINTLISGPRDQAAAPGPTPSSSPPTWRLDQIRHHIRSLAQNLDQVERGLASIATDPVMAQNRDVISLRADAQFLRGQTGVLNAMVDRLARESSASSQPSTQSTPSNVPVPASTIGAQSQSGPTQVQTSQGTGQPSVANMDPELFILSSPQGPVGILFDQRGTYSTAPMVSTLPFQTFTQQFSSNRQIIAGIGQQIAQNSNHLHNQLAAARPTRTQQPGPGAQAGADQPQNQNQNQNQNQDQNQNQNQDQNQNQNQNANQNANQNQNGVPAAENDRLGVMAGHVWLLLKLAVFIYFFAGGGGWYRPVMMGIVGVLVYLAQIGMFEDQFNLVRRHFEALLPLAERPQGAAAEQQQQTARRPNQNQNLTPEGAAQRLVRQHQNQRLGWIRETMRGAERSVAIFLASLWPGIGERMVEAQEARVRRVEEERLRLEEAQRQEAEAEQAKQAEEAGEGGEKKNAVENGPSGESSSSVDKGKGKGKERAEVAVEEGASSSSS